MTINQAHQTLAIRLQQLEAAPLQFTNKLSYPPQCSPNSFTKKSYPSQPCANPHTQPILYFRSLFLLRRAKKTIATAMGKSGAERRDGTKRRRRPATCALYLVLFPRLNRGRAHAVGRVGVVAKRRLGVERNGNEVLFRGPGVASVVYDYY